MLSDLTDTNIEIEIGKVLLRDFHEEFLSIFLKNKLLMFLGNQLKLLAGNKENLMSSQAGTKPTSNNWHSQDKKKLINVQGV